MTERREEILDAALALADERGLAAVSMRAVAERTGVTPMALYPYVGSKAALLDGMVGRLLRGLLPPESAAAAASPGAGGDAAAATSAAPDPAATGAAPDPAATSVAPDPAATSAAPGPALATDWRQRLRVLAYAARDLAHRHPWAAALLFSRPSVTPDAVRAVDQIYAALLDAGVPESQVPRLERLVSTVVLGYAASEVGGRFGPGTVNRGARREQRPATALPAHLRLARWLDAPVDWAAEFEADLADLQRLIELAASRQAVRPVTGPAAQPVAGPAAQSSTRD